MYSVRSRKKFWETNLAKNGRLRKPRLNMRDQKLRLRPNMGDQKSPKLSLDLTG